MQFCLLLYNKSESHIYPVTLLQSTRYQYYNKRGWPINGSIRWSKSLRTTTLPAVIYSIKVGEGGGRVSNDRLSEWSHKNVLQIICGFHYLGRLIRTRPPGVRLKWQPLLYELTVAIGMRVEVSTGKFKRRIC